MRVYLAGGMRSDWRSKVKLAAPQHVYLDPTEHSHGGAPEYKAWDLTAIRAADALFGFYASDNPSGFGLAVELGYAKGQGKLVILADERSASAADLARYIKFLRVTADLCYDTLDEAIGFLVSSPSLPPPV